MNVSGAQTSYTAALTTLADGRITSQLSVNKDSAGNTFTPVAGNTVTLDQEYGPSSSSCQAVCSATGL